MWLPFHPTRCPYGHATLEASAEACANMIDYVLEREGDICAVVAEAMRAVPIVPPPGFWKRVREICDRHGALLILDEIPTGLGKTGEMFSFQHDEIVPDIVTVGKSLGGGILPIAACIARENLDVCGDFAIGHYTHEKNPVTARAALTTLQIIEDEGLVERSAKLGEHAVGRLMDALQNVPIVGDIRGRGLMFGVEIVDDRTSKKPGNARAERIYYACLEAGLSFKISQGCVLTLSPPLTISQAELDQAIDIVIAAIKNGI